MKILAALLLGLLVVTFLSLAIGWIERPKAHAAYIGKEDKRSISWEVTKNEIISRIEEVVELSVRAGIPVRAEVQRWMFTEARLVVPLFKLRVAGWQLLDDWKDGGVVINLSLSRFPDRHWENIRVETGAGDGRKG